MNRSPSLTVINLSLVGVLLVGSVSPAAAESRLITGPRAGEPLAIALDYVYGHLNELGLTSPDVAEMVVEDHYRSSHNGVTHIFLAQRMKGIPVHNGILAVNVAADGSIINLHNGFASRLLTGANAFLPDITPLQAVAAAARHLDLEPASSPRVLELRGGATEEVLVSASGVSLAPIPVSLVYQANPEGATLAWSVEIQTTDTLHWWLVRVDATTGEVLDKNDWIVHDDWGLAAATDPRPSPSVHNGSAADAPDSYRAFPMPVESPSHGVRTLSVDPADPVASPLGWHDTDGSAGAEFTITRGNNVWAQEDRNGNNGVGYSPDGGGSLDFDFPLDPSQSPVVNEDAAITNLFYWNNLVHDVWYQYGFDEASGNFQENNYGKGGSGSDSVNADAQDGSGTNNANFGTPADGSNPRMQMFLWDPAPVEMVTINSPATIAGGYIAIPAVFGPSVPAAPADITANLVLVDDGTAAPEEGCSPLINGAQLSGNIALVQRGSCTFVSKVQNAENAGAVAVMVYNNVSGGPITMGGTDPGLAIPAVMVSMADGLLFRTQMPSPGVNASLSDPGVGPQLDGDFDNGIVAHEYGHGISNRLTGGRFQVSCLNNAEQMGEGWSDWFGLMMTIEPGDTGPDRRGIGTYALGQSTDGNGIRTYPYSTDMVINPHTYDDITTEAVPHGVGSVWAAMLWEMSWALIDRYGFDPDIYSGTGGNNMAMQLVIDGLKLQPCSPGFVTGRDAILAADLATYGGANECLIWAAFAKRGLGASASQGSSNSVGDGVEAFDLPPQCASPASPGVVTSVPLTLTRNGGSLDLVWGASCSGDADDYSVHEGAIGSWYGHASNLCTTGGATSTTLPSPAGSSYFIVVPTATPIEGSYGTDSLGAERPPSSVPCMGTSNLGC